MTPPERRLPIDAPAARAVVLLRHAEKPDPGAGVQGVDERGRRDDASLAVRGWQRAGALAHWLAPGDAPPRFGAPSALFAAPSTPRHTSRRPWQTLVPLARALSLEIRGDIDDDFPDRAAALLLAAAGTVVACGRHDALPALAHALARRLACDAGTIPIDWPAGRFDVAWLFDRAATGGAWRFAQVPQRLLDGDAPHGIDAGSIHTV